MSFVSRIFGTTSQADNAPQQNAPVQQTPTANPQPAPANVEPVSPLDQFKTLW